VTDETTPTPQPGTDLVDYATWTAQAAEGAATAHADAMTRAGERQGPDGHGKAYWSGYNAHWGTLLNAGLVR
jgi:hypothetical protein